MAEIDWVVVPSRWWENSPLVIQEAFLHGRPVICSDIGGMAEKVSDGVNGLHFRAGDAGSLALALERAATSADLWRTLQSQVPAIYDMESHIDSLRALYADQLERRALAAAELTT
jgi:glycosyltransferase involved in cell wall biosynthesis